jgi:hypothetical protein
MKFSLKTSVFLLGIVTIGLLAPVGNVIVADEWFVLSEQTIRSVDQGVNIKSQGGRWDKDVKQVKMSVEGADVEILEAVLHWDNRPDDTIADAGVLADGGMTTPRDAPGRKGRLTGVTVKYKIVGDAETAVLKVWGYD